MNIPQLPSSPPPAEGPLKGNTFPSRLVVFQLKVIEILKFRQRFQNYTFRRTPLSADQRSQYDNLVMNEMSECSSQPTQSPSSSIHYMRRPLPRKDSIVRTENELTEVCLVDPLGRGVFFVF